MPTNTCFSLTGAIITRIVSPLLATPPAPRPEMARPTIKALDVGAAPHTMLPTRKTAEKERYTQFRGKAEAIFPATGVKAQMANVYAAGYHAICDVSPNSVVMDGIACQNGTRICVSRAEFGSRGKGNFAPWRLC